MLHFRCDYQEGAHPRILERLLQTNANATVIASILRDL